MPVGSELASCFKKCRLLSKTQQRVLWLLGLLFMLVYLHFILEEEEKKVDATSIFFTILNIEVTVLGQKNSVVVVGLFDHIYGGQNGLITVRNRSLIVVRKFYHTNFF